MHSRAGVDAGSAGGTVAPSDTMHTAQYHRGGAVCRVGDLVDEPRRRVAGSRSRPDRFAAQTLDHGRAGPLHRDDGMDAARYLLDDHRVGGVVYCAGGVAVEPWKLGVSSRSRPDTAAAGET